MEEKDFDELLFEEKKNPKNLKNIILGAIIVVAILIVALLIWSFSKDSNQSADMESAQTEQIQDETYGDNTHHDHDLASDHDDRFDQIMKDVRNSIGKDGAETENTQEPLGQDSQTPDPQLQGLHMANNDEKQNVEDTQMEAPSMETPEFHPEGAIRPDKHDVPTPDEVMKAKKPHHPKPMHEPEPKKPHHPKPMHEPEPKKPHHPKPMHKPAPKPAPKLDLDAQGEVAAAGSYLQIGVFSKMPGQELQKLLKKHSYRIQEVWVNEQKLTKYLVGPFKNRSEASRYKMAHPDLEFSIYYEVK